jgi:hypothetical protein
MTFDPGSQDRIFFLKLSDWSYEREWRFVTALSAYRTSADGHLKLFDVDPRHVTAVICGWRVSSNMRSRLFNELVRGYPNVQLISAALDGGKIVLGPPYRKAE